MNIKNTKLLPCEKCGTDTPHFISVMIGMVHCTLCHNERKAKPDEIIQAIPITHGDRERRV